jgi:hypothetical protein
MEPTSAPRFGSKRVVTNLFCATALLVGSTSHAQLDPQPRQLLHLGVNQSLHNDGPQAHYLFYYWNTPDFPATNHVLRLVVAPLKGILGENTDLGLGVFGGGFAKSYDEVRRGNYFRDESFDGHGGGANVSLYHLFNPRRTVPLNGILRGTVDDRTFDPNSDTADNFALPEDQPFVTLRAGFRYGGQEPVLFPRLVVAHEIHRRSARKDGPLVRVNCASIPRELFESEFFGHVRGSFTGGRKGPRGTLRDGGGRDHFPG